MFRAIPLLLAAAIIPVLHFSSSNPAVAGDESPYVYKTEEAKRLLYEVPIDEFSERHKGEEPFVPFDPIRGVVVPTKEDDLASGRFAAELARFVAEGITYFRVGLYWGAIERSQDDWYFAHTAAILDQIAGSGGIPVAILGYTAEWATSEGLTCEDPPQPRGP